MAFDEKYYTFSLVPLRKICTISLMEAKMKTAKDMYEITKKSEDRLNNQCVDKIFTEFEPFIEAAARGGYATTSFLTSKLFNELVVLKAFIARMEILGYRVIVQTINKGETPGVVVSWAN